MEYANRYMDDQELQDSFRRLNIIFLGDEPVDQKYPWLMDSKHVIIHIEKE